MITIDNTSADYLIRLTNLTDAVELLADAGIGLDAGLLASLIDTFILTFEDEEEPEEEEETVFRVYHKPTGSKWAAGEDHYLTKEDAEEALADYADKIYYSEDGRRNFRNIFDVREEAI